MGQYYRPVFLNKKGEAALSVSSYDFGCGAKLMEHSWMKNPFVRFVEKVLMDMPFCLVWAGDYADIEQGLDRNLYNISYNGRPVLTHSEDVSEDKRWTHDYKTVAPLSAKYLINYTKKQFVNKSNVPTGSFGWQIHPLPLLTCEGNGRGGGDYRGESELIGCWARDLIGVTTRKSDIPKEFTELIFDLTE